MVSLLLSPVQHLLSHLIQVSPPSIPWYWSTRVTPLMKVMLLCNTHSLPIFIHSPMLQKPDPEYFFPTSLTQRQSNRPSLHRIGSNIHGEAHFASRSLRRKWRNKPQIKRNGARSLQTGCLFMYRLVIFSLHYWRSWQSWCAIYFLIGHLAYSPLFANFSNRQNTFLT